MKWNAVYVACFIFIIPSCFAFIFQSSIKYLLMQKAVTFTAEQITAFAHSREMAIEGMLKKLPQSIDYKCNSHDLSMLRDVKYYTQYIRVLGVVADNINCSSSGLSFNSPDFYRIYKQKRNGSYIFTAPQEGSEYVVVHKSNKGLLYAVLNNSWVEPILTSICNDCFSVRIYSNVENSYASITKGLEEHAILERSVSLNGGHFNVLVSPTMFFSDKISVWYRQFAYLFSLLLSGVLFCAFLCISAFFKKEVSLKDKISKALDNKEFIPYYQPVIDSKSNEVIGAEVLVRWITPNGSVINPSSFIHEIESDYAMLWQLTKLLINQVCIDKRIFDCHPEIWFSINIGAKHFMSNDLIKYMDKIKGVGNRIAFEITERQPLHDLGEVSKYVDELKALGHKIKIDDFGVGYGGFSYLQKINVDAIKIDKMFIDTIGTDDLKKNILDSIISMATEQNYEIIAEGVEKREQVEYLSARNVRLIQGYYYSAPLAFENLCMLVKRDEV